MGMYEQLPLFPWAAGPRASEKESQDDSTPPKLLSAPTPLSATDAEVRQLMPSLCALVDRKLHIFDKYPDLTRDDLVQEALIAVLKALPRFNQDRGARSTFIWTVAQ